MKNRKNYVMTKSNLTLTQSGLLAVLLQRQRHKVIQLAQRRAHGRQVRAPFWSSLTRWWGALTVMPQVYGANFDGNPDGIHHLELEGHERWNVRLIVGVNF